MLETSERTAPCGLGPHYGEGTKFVLANFPVTSFVLRLVYTRTRSALTLELPFVP